MKKQINIEGMSCGHCVKHVQEALTGIAGVEKVTVSLDEKNAVVELKNDVADAEFKNAIDDAGYDVASIVKL